MGFLNLLQLLLIPLQHVLEEPGKLTLRRFLDVDRGDSLPPTIREEGNMVLVFLTAVAELKGWKYFVANPLPGRGG
ncbi:hypothetical protein DVS31_11660 [Limosilactobacillus fermentum]|nr:hypothetical protein [Limosilactobacillus fermentum]